jgi:outer membrane protein assembly factor BamB
LAGLAADGTLRLHDLGTGARVREVTLDVHGATDLVAVVGDRVVAKPVDAGEATVFDLASGRALWRVPVQPDLAMVWSCGAVLCRGLGAWQRPTGIEGLDPDSGRPMWRLDGRTGPALADGRYLLVANDGESDVADADGAIVDAATGRVLRATGRWRPLADAAWPRFVVWQANPVGMLTFALFDGATGSVRVFGRSDDLYNASRCAVMAAALICQRSQTISVWRIPSGVGG